MAEPLFESISPDEFDKATQRTPRTKTSTGDKELERTQTVWFTLPSRLGACTVPSHDHVVGKITDPIKKAYREAYGHNLRMVYTIGEYDVCRDCFLMEADK